MTFLVIILHRRLGTRLTGARLGGIKSGKRLDSVLKLTDRSIVLPKIADTGSDTHKAVTVLKSSCNGIDYIAETDSHFSCVYALDRSISISSPTISR